ncbi:MAG: hypothetical protein JWQ03_3104 [Variovorax sp.]|nr:hypothetical protein [Variovorax sp.]
MKLWEHWQVYALMLFAVAAGQIGRLGQKLERGQIIGAKQVLVELSMLPAFGSLGGALAAEHDWPIWAVIGSGISAGWMGFASFRLIVAAFRTLAKQFVADIKD